MMAELRMEMAEQKTIEDKAKAYDTLIELMNNAIGYMTGRMDENEIADTLDTSVEMIDAILNEDYEEIANLS